MSIYTSIIEKVLKELKVSGVKPHHVEAWMRLKFSVLDGLSYAEFRREVRETVEIILAGPISESEALAATYGLKERHTTNTPQGEEHEKCN